MGYVSAFPSDYARAQESGVRCVTLLMETFGGMSPQLFEALCAAAEWRNNKLMASEYDETTWSARTWMAFATYSLRSGSPLRRSSLWHRRWRRLSACQWRLTPARGER